MTPVPFARVSDTVRYIAHHPELARRYGSDCAYCVGFSHDLPVRLREEAFTAAFIDGWRYECVWEATTRQDAELIVKVFRREKWPLMTHKRKVDTFVLQRSLSKKHSWE